MLKYKRGRCLLFLVMVGHRFGFLLYYFSMYGFNFMFLYFAELMMKSLSFILQREFRSTKVSHSHCWFFLCGFITSNQSYGCKLYSFFASSLQRTSSPKRFKNIVGQNIPYLSHVCFGSCRSFGEECCS